MSNTLTAKPTVHPSAPPLQWEQPACNLCGREDAEPYHVERLPYFDQMVDFQIVRCRQCGLVYTCPRLAAHNATYQLATTIDEPMVEAHGRAKAPVFARALREIGYWRRQLGIHDDGLLLDVGCGSGHFLAAARREGYNGCGLEPVVEMADYARQHFDVSVVKGDLFTVHLPAGAYDVITAWDVLEHLSDPLAAMKRFYQWLRPGGILAARFPSSPWHKFKAVLLHRCLGSRRPVFSPTMHYYFFDEKTFTCMAESAGLRLLGFKTTPLEANTDSVMLNMVKAITQKGLGGLEWLSGKRWGNLEVYCQKPL